MKIYVRRNPDGTTDLEGAIKKMSNDAKDSLQIIKDKEYYMTPSQRKKLKQERNAKRLKSQRRKNYKRAVSKSKKAYKERKNQAKFANTTTTTTSNSVTETNTSSK